MRLFLVLLAFFAGFPVFAAESRFDSTHKAWNVFTSGKGAEKVCYATGTPTKEKGTFKKRGEPYVLVTVRKNGGVEVSVSSGYPYKEGSSVILGAGKSSFKLFTTNETPKIAWAQSAEDDKKIVAAMKKEGKLTVKGESQKGTDSADTYSLDGFTAAYKRITALCK